MKTRTTPKPFAATVSELNSFKSNWKYLSMYFHMSVKDPNNINKTGINNDLCVSHTHYYMEHKCENDLFVSHTHYYTNVKKLFGCRNSLLHTDCSLFISCDNDVPH